MGPESSKRRASLIGAGALTIGAALPRFVGAQTGFPSKPIRLIVPFAPGGAADIAARHLAPLLSAELGKPVLVENRGGGDGAIAGIEVAKSAPDGHTIFFSTASALSYVPAVRKNPPYDVLNDFTPITNFCRFTFFLCVHSSLPVTTVTEFVAHLRANPGKLAYGTGNTTSVVATAQFLQNTGTDMVHVPYKGEAQALLDFTTGRIQAMFATPAVTTPMLRENKMRALAVLLPARSALLPEVPTMTEAGLPLVNIDPWGGFVAPAKVPREIVDRLAQALHATMKKPELLEQMDRLALAIRPSTPQELGDQIKAQLAVWSKSVRAAGIPVE